MRSHPKIVVALICAVAIAVGFSACGTQGISVPASSPYHNGAVLFLEHCSGCHTLAVVGAEGSATSIKDRVRTNGPNFNYRKDNVAQVLYALHNGGFSGAIMPQNIVVGQQAQEVAQFLAKYSGLQAPKVPVIENTSFGAATKGATTIASESSTAAGAKPNAAGKTGSKGSGTASGKSGK